MQNRFESNFTLKLYKKKLEEIRKFHRSIAKFKKIFKMKNEEFDNLSDKRFKDIVDAYKRNHPIEKKNIEINNKNKQEQLPIFKRAKSQCFDDFDIDDNRINIYEKISKDENNQNINNKKEIHKKKIHFENNVVSESNKNQLETNFDKKQESVRKYESLNKNNIHLFDFNSHPSKFFNQN